MTVLSADERVPSQALRLVERLRGDRRTIQQLEQRVADLQRELRAERVRRGNAEANARRFHALMLEARVRAIPVTRNHETAPAATPVRGARPTPQEVNGR